MQNCNEKLKRLFALDIETVTQGKRAKDYTDKDNYSVGNAKSPEAVAKTLKKKREEAGGKHALKWWTGKVISVATERCDDPEKRVCFYGHEEKDVLHQLSYEIEAAQGLIGMYSKNFDFPFLVGRYLANNMPVPSVLMDRYKLYDIDDFFGWSSASGQRGKLAHYIQGLGLDVKPMAGGDVGTLYAEIMAAAIDKDEALEAELWSKLVAYNQLDTNTVAEIARRYWR